MRVLSWVLLGQCGETVSALVWVRARNTLMPTYLCSCKCMLLTWVNGMQHRSFRARPRCRYSAPAEKALGAKKLPKLL